MHRIVLSCREMSGEQSQAPITAHKMLYDNVAPEARLHHQSAHSHRRNIDRASQHTRINTERRLDLQTSSDCMMLPQWGWNAHPDAVRKVEPPAARDNFTCCTALSLLWCCRRLRHRCGCIEAASMRCVIVSNSAMEPAAVRLLKRHVEL